MGTNTRPANVQHQAPSLLRFIAVNCELLGFEWTSKGESHWDFAPTPTRPQFRVESDGADNYIYLWNERPLETPAWVSELIAAWMDVVKRFPSDSEPSWHLVWKYGVMKFAEASNRNDAPEQKPDTVGFDAPSMVEFLRMHLAEYGLVLDPKDEGKGYHMLVAADGERNRFALNVKSYQVEATIWTVEPRSGVPEWLKQLRKAYEAELARWHGTPQHVKLAVTWQFRLPSVPTSKMTAE